MATFYLDYESGNDNNAGDSFNVTLQGTDAQTFNNANFTSASSSFDSSLIGRYISIFNAGAWKTYIIATVPSSTQLTLTVISGGFGNPSSASGQTWIIGGRWKTFTLGASAVRTVPGDTIRIMASPDATSLGQSGTWTFGQKRIVLQSGVTSGIDGGETNWSTSGGNITFIDVAQFKEGTGSQKITISGTYGTGVAAYKTIPSTNYSAFNQISFWIRNSVALPSGATGIHTAIALCSDTTGTVPVNKFKIPPIPSVSQWVPITIDNGAALGSAIQSVALYIDVKLAAATDINLDNIIACKDPSLPDSLSLTSLIGKNYGDETFWGIQSISGVNVALDAHNNNLGNAGRGYAGNTEMVETWKRETIKLSMATTASTNVSGLGTTQEAGAINNHTFYEGGWDRTGMTLQNSQSWFDGQNGLGNLIDNSNNFNFLSWSNLAACRGNNPFRLGAALSTSYFILKNIYGANNSNIGLSLVGNHVLIQNCKAINANLSALNPSWWYMTGDIRSISSNLAGPTILGNSSTISATKFLNNASAAFGVSNQTTNCIFNNIFCSGNGNGPAYNSNSIALTTCHDSIFADTTPVQAGLAFGNAKFISINHNQITGDHRIFTDGGLIQTESSIVHTANSNSWKLSPTSTNRSPLYPLDYKIASIAVKPNSPVTGKIWAYRTNTDLTGYFVVPPNQEVCPPASGAITGLVSGWYEIPVVANPTQSGVINFEVWCFGGVSNSLYIDDFSVSQ